MKVINKILCFLSVLLFSVPFFCFNVSADDSVFDDSLLSSLPDFDTTDFSEYDLDYCEQALKSILTPATSDEIKEYRKDPFYLPVKVTINDNSYLGVTKRCEQSVFLISLINSLKKGSIVTTSPVYYFLHSFSYVDSDFTSNNDPIYTYNYIFSNTPFSFVTNSDSYASIKMGQSCFYHERINYPATFFSNIGSSTTNGSTYFCYSTDSFQFAGQTYAVLSSSYSNSYEHISAFCNFDIEGSELFSCDLPFSNGFSSVKPKTLSDEVDVKLTPEFGLDMDRIDPLTNQSDYFKFEVTNNSDSAIQWCAGIYDPELVTADTMDILNLSSWAYVSRTTYYDFSVKEDKGIFRTTYTYSGALKTGSFDYHYLQPGETFSDLIFWENINIKPNVIYHFFVNAVKTDLNYSSLNIDPPVTEESSDMHSVTVIEDSYFNTILEGASSFRKLDSNIYNIEFSCLSMPSFTTTVRGGNSVLNTSGNDRYLLRKNYETVSDINGLDTKINKDFTDPSILANTFNRSDVSVDIDSFSVDDVKSYITSCQSFFILIKEALLSFPAFIWALICFGLTGLIVIAVVKALL